MPILVNGELVTRDLVREEAQRMREMPEWRNLPESLEKCTRLQEAAEICAINRVLLRQLAAKDTRPVDAEIVASEVQRRMGAGGCGAAAEATLRRQVEEDLRFGRTMRDVMGPVPPPAEEDIARFHAAHGHNFHRPERVQAAHIVRHVDATHTEEEARAGIEAAFADLEGGEPFATAAERHSDCKGNGGDLGWFPRGAMVEEFERVVFALKPGERSGIVRTPMGFHIAEVRSRQPAGPAALDEVRKLIGDFLTATTERDALQRATAQMRARADIRRISSREAEQLASEPVLG